MSSDDPKWNERMTAEIERKARRHAEAERNRSSMLAQTVFLGTLGGLFVLPVIVGAYLGSWLDNRLPGYSIHWTLNLILLGVIVGGVNVYYFIKTHR